MYADVAELALLMVRRVRMALQKDTQTGDTLAGMVARKLGAATQHLTVFCNPPFSDGIPEVPGYILFFLASGAIDNSVVLCAIAMLYVCLHTS